MSARNTNLPSCNPATRWTVLQPGRQSYGNRWRLCLCVCAYACYCVCDRKSDTECSSIHTSIFFLCFIYPVLPVLWWGCPSAEGLLSAALVHRGPEKAWRRALLGGKPATNRNCCNIDCLPYLSEGEWGKVSSSKWK